MCRIVYALANSKHCINFIHNGSVSVTNILRTRQILSGVPIKVRIMEAPLFKISLGFWP